MVGTPLSLQRSIPVAGSRSGRTSAAFGLLGRTHVDADRQHLRDQIVLLNVGVARSLAQRFRLRGVDAEDLDQVAYAGLVRSVRRFDASIGHDFLSYAIPTIRGEIRRHFRDDCWAIRVPRSVQETQQELRTVDPSIDSVVRCSDARLDELALAVDRPRKQVVDALAARGCFRPASLDLPVTDGESVSLGDSLAAHPDDWASTAETRVMLHPLLAALGLRDQRIVRLRYVEELSQAGIAADLGVSKMQVSRLLGRIHRQLRVDLTGDRAGALTRA